MRSEAKTQRARRKLRVLQQAKRRAQMVEPVSLVAPTLASVLAGYELCARRTNAPNVAVAVKHAAASLKKLAGFATVRMGERLRWEWLASTAFVTDGSPDARLLAECASLLRDALALEPANDRLRVASAEAWSLAAAVAPARAGLLVPVAL